MLLNNISSSEANPLPTSKPTPKPINILVLCTGNSARSVMAEALFNQISKGIFSAYSAGSHPSGRVNPYALEQISALNINYQPRSKSWDEFAQPNAVAMDIVLTVCGNAAQEICPHFIGTPQHVHWGLPDPAAINSDDEIIRRAFRACYQVFDWRIQRLLTILSEKPYADVLATMNSLANQYPSLPEINENGFTSVIQ